MNQPESLGAYELIGPIGGGGMGTVYRARDRRTDMIVAVKVIHEHLSADPQIVARFRDEALIGSVLTSPYTVRVHEYGQDKGRYFIASEYVEGTSLASQLQQGALDPARALTIALEVALALTEAEARKVIHRDIKPSNILIGSDGSVKVTDFGIARLASGGDLTITGAYLGTIAYSAPEQIRGVADIRADFYSLGVTLYQCLTGELPFRGDTPFQLAAAVEQEPPPLDRIAGLPPPIVQVIERCLKKDPSERYQTAADLAEAIRSARRSLTTADDTVLTPVPPTPQPPPPPSGSAGGGAASPPAVAAAGGKGRLPPIALFALAGGAGLIVGVVALVLLLTGGDDNGGNVVAPTATATVTPRPTLTPTRPPPPTPRPTLPPPPSATPRPGPTIIPPVGEAPRESFVTGEWTFAFFSVFNDCPDADEFGDELSAALVISEVVADDGYIENGEGAYVFEEGELVGELLFYWPVLEVSYSITDGSGTGFIYSEFFNAGNGWGRLEGRRFVEGVQCTVIWEEERPPGFTPLFER